MGDHRASIKCQVKMHGVEDECDMWINWFPETGTDGVDRRVIEFFSNWAARALEKYEDERYEAEREQRDKDERERDLRELARLKAKYEGS